VLKAIRENEPRAISLGYDVDRYKLLAFVLSAALAGLAGATKTLVFQLCLADRRALAHVGRGGADDAAGRPGHRASARWSAPVIVGAAELLADKVGSWVTVIMGVIFVVCVLAFCGPCHTRTGAGHPGQQRRCGLGRAV
jgi:branched-chain amino acid transport system permease protein